MLKLMLKHKSKIFGTISFVGFLFLVGTVGMMDYAVESDVETITCTEIIVRSIVGLIMFGGGAKLSGAMDESNIKQNNCNKTKLRMKTNDFNKHQRSA